MNEESSPGGRGLEQEIWYYRSEGIAEGPVRRRELLGLLARGELDRDTPVWRPGMDDWTPAREVGSLSDMLPPRPGERSAEEDSDDEVVPPAPPDPPPEAESEEAPPPQSSEDVLVDGEEEEETVPAPEWFSGWLPVSAGVALVVGTGLAAWLIVGGVGGDSGMSASDDPGSSPRGAAIERVRRDHRAALADSLALLPSADSLLRLHSSRGLAWTRRTAFSGLRRMSDRPLVTHAELMGRALAAAPAALCASVARWEATSDEYWRFVSGLGPDRMERLLEIYRGGVMAELRGKTPLPAPDRDAVAAAFSMLGEGLSGAARDSLRRVLAPDSDPGPDAACWVERTIYRGVPQLPDPWRAVLARAVVTG